MSSVTVRWKLSEKAQMATFVATGKKPDENYSLEIDLVDCTPGERALLIEGDAAQLGPIGLSQRPEFDETYKDFEKPHYLTPILYYNSEPTLAQILAHIKAARDVRALIKSHVAEKEEQGRQEQKRLLDLHNEFLPQVEALIKAYDYETLGKLPPSMDIPGDVYLFSPRVGNSLSRLVSDARREIAKERRLSSKTSWIEMHGSDHLKRAFEAGYSSQRRYVIKRAGLEVPGFTVDFNDAARWKDRSFPSESALNLADTVASLGNVEVIWLTKPAQQDIVPELDGRDEPFEPREAVVIRGYLSKYDLVSN